MKFVPTKLTVELEDGRTVDFDFGKSEDFIVSSSAPLTPSEKHELLVRVGIYMGAGTKAMVDPD